MIRIRRAAERGTTTTGWLDSRHAFSFADYHDPLHMQFGSLRVFNDDSVAPGAGFPPHPHQDMEIVSYVVRGAMAHRDSSGGLGVIREGEVQRMSAGTGIVHSEFNASPKEPLHFLQMWILPERRGLTPSHEQKGWSREERDGQLLRVVSPEGADGELRIHQQAAMFLGSFAAGATLEHRPTMGSRAYLHLIDGSLTLGAEKLHPGDAVLFEGEEELRLEAMERAEVLLWDMA